MYRSIYRSIHYGFNLFDICLPDHRLTLQIFNNTEQTVVYFEYRLALVEQTLMDNTCTPLLTIQPLCRLVFQSV